MRPQPDEAQRLQSEALDPVTLEPLGAPPRRLSARPKQGAPEPCGPGASRPSLTPPDSAQIWRTHRRGLPGLEPFLRIGLPARERALAFHEADLPGYLAKLGLLSPDEPASVERAGDGKHQLGPARTLARTRALVRGEAGPPRARALPRVPRLDAAHRVRGALVRRRRALRSGGICPRVHHFDAQRKALVLEDLAGAEPLDALLARGGDAAPAAAALGALPRRGPRRNAGSRASRPASRTRRCAGCTASTSSHCRFAPNDFPLSPALARRARRARGGAGADPAHRCRLRRAISSAPRAGPRRRAADQRAGRRERPKLLDAEIAHVGDPAFDVGQLAGHLWLRALARGEPRAAAPAVGALWSAYADGARRRARCRLRDALVYAGIEMLRRTLGAARVPEAGPRRDRRCARSTRAAPGCSRRLRIPRCYRWAAMPGALSWREPVSTPGLWLLLGGWIGCVAALRPAGRRATAFRVLPSTRARRPAGAGRCSTPCMATASRPACCWRCSPGVWAAAPCWSLPPAGGGGAPARSRSSPITPQIDAIRPLVFGPEGSPGARRALQQLAPGLGR